MEVGELVTMKATIPVAANGVNTRLSAAEVAGNIRCDQTG